MKSAIMATPILKGKHKEGNPTSKSLAGIKFRSLNTSSVAYLFPTICISKFVRAYFSDTPLRGSFNVILNEEYLSQIYQLPQGASLSIPVINKY